MCRSIVGELMVVPLANQAHDAMSWHQLEEKGERALSPSDCNALKGRKIKVLEIVSEADSLRRIH